MPSGPQCDVWGRLYPVFSINSAASMTFTTRGRRGSGSVSRMLMREDRRPGTTRYRRFMCGCGEYGQRHELQAFHQKWCSSSPAPGMSTRAVMLPYALEPGSTSMTAMASFPSGSGLRSAM